jgi:flagellar hook-basal body complex protein FliE
MAIQLPSIQSINAALPDDISPARSAAPSSFGESLNKIAQAVDASTGEANSAISKMLDGTGDVHDAMIALQRAETTLELTVQMRNKFVQAYQDIMRMPV